MGISILPLPSSSKTRKGAFYTSSTSWTAPSTVDYVRVKAKGGGGGGAGVYYNIYGQTTTLPSSGTASTFGSTLVIARGGVAGEGGYGLAFNNAQQSPSANSGQGGNAGVGTLNGANASSSGIFDGKGSDGTYVDATIQVTPGVSYTITVGGGGAGSANPNSWSSVSIGSSGGSGWMSLEWDE